MAFDPQRFIAVADFLDDRAQTANEEKVRTAIGRAYYAAYLQARERLRALNRVAPSGEGQHTWLLSTLKLSRNSNVRTLGQELGQIFARRKSADYDLSGGSKYPPGDGANAADRARRWIARFQAIPDGQLLL